MRRIIDELPQSLRTNVYALINDLGKIAPRLLPSLSSRVVLSDTERTRLLAEDWIMQALAVVRAARESAWTESDVQAFLGRRNRLLSADVTELRLQQCILACKRAQSLAGYEVIAEQQPPRGYALLGLIHSGAYKRAYEGIELTTGAHKALIRYIPLSRELQAKLSAKNGARTLVETIQRDLRPFSSELKNNANILKMTPVYTEVNEIWFIEDLLDETLEDMMKAGAVDSSCIKRIAEQLLAWIIHGWHGLVESWPTGCRRCLVGSGAHGERARTTATA